ncbi:MAG: nucleotide kinase domain-containing protein [Patescibacteria group bacterium]
MINYDGVVPRDDVFELYWHFASERHQAYLRRLEGESQPWTDDSVLQQYKFCNVYRVLDRVTQFLLTDVLYADDVPNEPRAQLFRALVFRFFSKPETWIYLENSVGQITDSAFDKQTFVAALDDLKSSGQSIYTGAFILCANNAFDAASKHANHAELFSRIASGEYDTLDRILSAESLQQVYEALLELPLIGKFMAYQIAIDMNYSAAIDFPEDSFVVAGPGAERGIAKCFESKGSKSTAELIQWIQHNQEELAHSYGYEAPTLFGRRLQSIDCQGLFCETDKYARVVRPDIKSARKRMKSTFKPRSKVDQPFLPPKWNILKY